VKQTAIYSSDKPYRTGIDRSNSNKLHLSVENQEIEHWNFGNAFFFNIPNAVQDPVDKPVEMTPLFHYDQQAHDMGGITLRYMRSRPFDPRGGGQQQPELAVSAALGLMDVWTVMENSMQNLLAILATDGPGMDGRTTTSTPTRTGHGTAWPTVV
jgi:hypothetical protein